MVDLKAARDFARIYSYSRDSDPAASCWIEELVAEVERLEKTATTVANALQFTVEERDEARRQLAIANGLIKELRVDLTVARDALEWYEANCPFQEARAREALAKIGGTDA